MKKEVLVTAGIIVTVLLAASGGYHYANMQNPTPQELRNGMVKVAESCSDAGFKPGIVIYDRTGTYNLQYKGQHTVFCVNQSTMRAIPSGSWEVEQ